MSGSDLSSVGCQPVSRPQDSIPTSLDQQFRVRFWGVRGGIPTPCIETMRYGGNTACVELQIGGQRLIFDGGTGLRALGRHLCKQMPVEAHLFFTQTHWDRIQGFPFFSPAFVQGNCFHIYGAMSANGASIKQCLSEQMLRPNFSVPLQVMRSNLKFHDITPGSVITLGDVTLETISLNRLNGAIGYRITWNGRSVVYATDIDHTATLPDPSLVYLADQADVLILDADDTNLAFLNPEQVATYLGIWKERVALAIAANAKKLILFHHNPEHDDNLLDQLELEAQTYFSNTWFAREGMILDLFGEDT